MRSTSQLPSQVRATFVTRSGLGGGKQITSFQYEGNRNKAGIWQVTFLRLQDCLNWLFYNISYRTKAADCFFSKYNCMQCNEGLALWATKFLESLVTSIQKDFHSLSSEHLLLQPLPWILTCIRSTDPLDLTGTEREKRIRSKLFVPISWRPFPSARGHQKHTCNPSIHQPQNASLQQLPYL